MADFLVSFGQQNFRLSGKWLFQRCGAMRFEWLALLAFKRATVSPDQAWASVEEIRSLPHWRKNSKKNIGTNVGRYLQSFGLHCDKLVVANTQWAGPYRLNVSPTFIRFDIPTSQVRHILKVRASKPAIRARKDLLAFTFHYARAQRLFFQGRLVPLDPTSDSAYDRFAALAENDRYGPTLRLLASLSAADVLYRRGRIGIARRWLLQNARLARSTPDVSLKAQFHLRLAWAYQRASTGLQSDRLVKSALNRATPYAENSGDRAALALLAFRWSGYLTKKGHHQEAVDQLCLALEGYLITGNYDGVQATCGNIGSVVHRLGLGHYKEARKWLLLSVAIARWMRIGRDDAHAETILGKIYTETDNKAAALSWLQRAELIAEQAGGKINLADTKMVLGFYYRKFGTREKLVETLASALSIFRSLTEFDVRQKERYMENCFSEAWSEVLDRCSKTTDRERRRGLPAIPKTLY